MDKDDGGGDAFDKNGGIHFMRTQTQENLVCQTVSLTYAKRTQISLRPQLCLIVMPSLPSLHDYPTDVNLAQTEAETQAQSTPHRRPTFDPQYGPRLTGQSHVLPDCAHLHSISDIGNKLHVQIWKLVGDKLQAESFETVRSTQITSTPSDIVLLAVSSPSGVQCVIVVLAQPRIQPLIIPVGKLRVESSHLRVSLGQRDSLAIIVVRRQL